MATNPMKRQARTSFLLGVVVTLIIAALIIVFLFMQLKKLNEQIKAEQEAKVKVYILNQDVKSGQVITENMFVSKEVNRAGVPSDATSDINQMISTYSLCDKAGNNIYTKSDGLLYMQTSSGEVKVEKEDSTGNYYTQQGSNKTYIETTQKPLIAKVAMKANTVITASLITRADQINTSDVRTQEYNVVVLPTDLFVGDYIDVRLMLPNGEDFIVVSKKEVNIPQADGEYLVDTISINLSEDEILHMSCAIVEAFKTDGSKLYATKYADAGSQDAATPTYVASEAVTQLMAKDPNITEEAMKGLNARYTDDLKNVRNKYIEGALSTYGDDENVPDKMDESITSSQESRQKYLQSLVGTSEEQ